MFILLMGIFALGLIRLFQIRFETGDVYPRYSSLRKDPLGTCALFKGISDISDNPVFRNYKQLDKIPMSSDTTLFILGLPKYEQPLIGKNWEGLLNRLFKDGGRLVISFSSFGYEPEENAEKEDKKKKQPEKSDADETSSESGDGSEEKKEDMASEEDEDEKDKWSGIRELGIAYVPFHKYPSEEEIAIRATDAPDGFPKQIFWRLGGYFTLNDPSWQQMYTQNETPVVVSREWGKGSLVMLADSYLFSNEGLSKHRAPFLLAWTVGPSNKIIFDEFHHGLLETIGTVDLIKKYRLQGVVLSLFFVVGLLIWRQMALMPVASNGSDTPIFFSSEDGADSSEGWVALVERHIPTTELLNVSYDAWLASEASKRMPKDRLEAAKKIMAKHNSTHQPNKNKTTYTTLYHLIKQGKLS